MEKHGRQVVLEEFRFVVETKLSHYVDAITSMEVSKTADGIHGFCDCVPYEEDIVCSLIRMTGEDVNGSLAVLSSVATVFELSATEVASATDWVGELANLTMGALKNRLSEYGIASRLGLPVAERGLQRKFWKHDGDSVAFLAKAAVGPLCFVLNYQVSDKTWSRNPALATNETGKVCLF